jgi:hypothetical protein
MVLVCGSAVLPALDDRVDVRVHNVPARPGKDAVDPLLAELDATPEDRLIVHGTDGDLAAVVLRLMRTDRLTTVPVGFVPASPESEVAITWHLPDDPGRALDVALGGDADRVPLIRDDVGGVLVGLGTIGPLRGVAYCDDTQVLRGPAKLVRVTPSAIGGGLEVSVAHRGLFDRRSRTTTGRAFEVGCLATRVVRDGVVYEKPVKRWNWYRHTEDLRLIRGVA